MAHQAQLEFVGIIAKHFPRHFTNARVLEIGSLDINGSVRSAFKDCVYTGLDVAPGPGVDVVCQGQEFDASSGSFDVVISCEAMEHNPYWKKTFQNMVRLCRPGGLVIMTCATVGRPEHGTTRKEPNSSPLTVALRWDYYKNLRENDFRGAVDLASEFGWSKFWNKWQHFDLLFAGIRAPLTGDSLRSESTATEKAVGDWIDVERQVRAIRYRDGISKYVGDYWFDGMRWLASRAYRIALLLDRMHGLK